MGGVSSLPSHPDITIYLGEVRPCSATSLSANDTETPSLRFIMDDTPQRPSAYKIGSLRGFLPLSDAPVTTRGQKLPSLIQHRSTTNTNIEHIKKRRQVTIAGGSDDENAESERNADGADVRWDGPASATRKPSRRASVLSESSQVLNTPQMRSLRLIRNRAPH